MRKFRILEVPLAQSYDDITRRYHIHRGCSPLMPIFEVYEVKIRGWFKKREVLFFCDDFTSLINAEACIDRKLGLDQRSKDAVKALQMAPKLVKEVEG